METFIYLSPQLPDLTSPLYRVNRAGRSLVQDNFQIKRDSSYPLCNLHLVLSGSMTVCWRQTEWVAKAGELFLLPSYEPHEYAVGLGDQADLLWIEFYGADASSHCLQLLGRNGPVFAVTGMADLLFSLHHQLIGKGQTADVQSDLESQLQISRLIYEILMTLWAPVIQRVPVKPAGLQAVEGPDSPKNTASQINAVVTVIDHIRQYPAASHSVKELSNLVCFNSTYFAKFFHQVTGSTPARYIAAQKIILARTLLTRDDSKISEIAGQLGYCSPSHFIRQFKKLTGLSPAAYRFQNKQYRHQ